MIITSNSVTQKPNWADGPLVGFDVETTGVNPAECRIVTAAIVLDAPGQPEQTWEWLINPGVPIPLEATAVNGISTEAAEIGGVSPAIAMPQIFGRLFSLCGDYQFGPYTPLVAYNSVYDISCLFHELRRHDPVGYAYGETYDTLTHLPIIDPMILDRKLDPYRRGRRTQTAVASAHGVTVIGAHTALGDVRTSLKLARVMGHAYPHIGRKHLAELHEMQTNAHREHAAQFQAYRRREDPEFVCAPEWPIISA
jgi:DNA polymerase-3 subunit epsilon